MMMTEDLLYHITMVHQLLSVQVVITQHLSLIVILMLNGMRQIPLIITSLNL